MPTNTFAAMLSLLLITTASPQQPSSDRRPRCSDIGLKVGILPHGPLGAITAVASVEVGHTTIIRGK